MAQHNVFFELPRHEMGKVDADFYIQKNGAVLGRMRISKGGLDYYPANKKKPIKIDWTKFDEMVKNWNGE